MMIPPSGRSIDSEPRWLPIGFAILLCAIGTYQPTFAQRGVYKGRLVPHWSADGKSFWYRNDLPDGRREFMLVDAEKGERQPAFDHRRLAEGLAAAGVSSAAADRLPVDDLEFRFTDNTFLFRLGDADWRCRLDTYDLTRSEEPRQRRESSPSGSAAAESIPRASRRTGPETELEFENRTGEEMELFWLDPSGQRRSYGRIANGGRHRQHTYAGHVWEVVGRDGRMLDRLIADELPGIAIIAGGRDSQRREPGGRRPTGPARDISPDGKWQAFVQDHNLFVRALDGDQVIQVSHDGEPGDAYQSFEWSPNGQTLVAFRVDPGDEGEVHLIQSSPPGGGRAQLRSHPYALPGDKMAAYELNLFRCGDWQPRKPEVERIDFGRPRLRWHRDGARFTYEKTDRGHQRFRILEVDTRAAAARTILDEQSETFIWTVHNNHGPITTYLEQTPEIIYVSERDGWRHLYLVDAERGEISNQMTKGPWVVRGIDRIDEEQRQIWFRCSGYFPDQDPYLIHYARVDFDGSHLVLLTAGNGNHSVRYAPDHRYLVDTYSRVDQAAVHELRRISDGSLVCPLETADITALVDSGWQSPEVFSAKGRDGVTDIWGVIYRPRPFDPEKKYPVIEAIYAGPQDSYVPKSFQATQRYSSLTELGFVVVQIDGMGTANRSKAFHDICWRNLKDAGFPDRIRWHQAVGEKYPWYDLTRVGIFGGSAGGQNSTAALLFHPDFYHVAVSSCGCHDNRMDKASWNEQWMGFPVGPQYAESSNIENAHRLRGKLMLIVGELDTNVPPESTFRLADALIRAGKDFELVVIPGAGHGDGGPYGERRRQDFFVRHLLGVEPPDRNATR